MFMLEKRSTRKGLHEMKAVLQMLKTVKVDLSTPLLQRHQSAFLLLLAQDPIENIAFVRRISGHDSGHTPHIR